ncbi:MAG TPA: nitroreductase, partial [Acidimicrobiia bacterium]|nr:nitroreductase [Acidimicrobiia bacterium]
MIVERLQPVSPCEEIAVDALDCLLHRCSVKRTVDPAPTGEHLSLMLAAACQAPDHGRLRPWRFITVAGDARTDLGKIFAEALAARDPGCPQTKLEREAGKLRRAPLVIVVVCHPTPGCDVPFLEQAMSVAAAAQNIVNAAYALGYGAMWRTGAQAYDPAVHAALGLEAGESIIGFLYVGSPE